MSVCDVGASECEREGASTRPLRGGVRVGQRCNGGGEGGVRAPPTASSTGKPIMYIKIKIKHTPIIQYGRFLRAMDAAEGVAGARTV